MNKLNVLFLILLLPFIILIRLFTPNKARRGRMLTDIIERKYPKYKIVKIDMQYDDDSSVVSSADKDKNTKGAVVVIENNGERRILHLLFTDDIWHITQDVPDRGNDIT
ncbi:MAG: hypothetical protein J5582_10535 [Ruminococcus sp.]|uniref:hypothetical protein n=1 Tax=Ruminococcus sp. TaxID=41978 RepID=UPI0025F9947F|nr:hypothetical protein [Ruminococcus sp.]MBO4866977.1 hypothetical protein [Ruminococcus sp.]